MVRIFAHATSGTTATARAALISTNVRICSLLVQSMPPAIILWDLSFAAAIQDSMAMAWYVKMSTSAISCWQRVITPPNAATQSDPFCAHATRSATLAMARAAPMTTSVYMLLPRARMLCATTRMDHSCVSAMQGT